MTRDIDRLRMLAREGDPESAWRLWHEARRRDDLDLAAEAAVGIGEPDLLAELAVRLWDADRVAALDALARTCGVALDEFAREAIDQMLEHANAGRYARQLDRSGALSALFEARLSPLGIGVRHAGEAYGGQGHPRTSLACAVRASNDDTVMLGITDCAAVAPTPGRAWRELSPWRAFVDDNLERARAWADEDARSATRHRITCVATDDTRRLLAAVARAHEARDPLAELLTGERTDKQFKLVVRTIDKLPKKDTDAIEVAVERAERALGDWPDTARVATVAVWKRLAGGRDKPSDCLLRHLHHDKCTDTVVREIASSPAAARFHSIELYEQHPDADNPAIEPDALAELAASPHLASLGALEITTMYHRGLDYVPLLTHGAGLSALRALTIACGRHTPLPQPERLRAYALPAVETLKLWGCIDGPALAALLAAPAFASVRQLDLSHTRGLAEHIGCIGHAPYTPHLDRLALTGCALTDASLESLAAATMLRSLAELVLDGNPAIGARGLDALVAAPFAPTLVRLELPGDGLGDEGAAILGEADAMEALEHLTMLCDGYDDDDTGRLTPAGGVALATARWWATLRSLDLTGQKIGSEGLEAIVSAPHQGRQLESLSLRANEIGSDGARALADSPAMARLERLDLSFNPIGAAGFAAIVRSPHLTSLRSLLASSCDIGPEGAIALAGSEHLPALENVVIDGNPIEAAGTTALAGAERLARLCWISLHSCKLGKGALKILEASPWLEGRFTGLPGHPSHGRQA